MATFTMPLKRVIELTGGEVDFSTGVAVMTGGNIGLAHYPLHDEAHRPTLTGKIIDHYWNREIGVESVDMFQMNMRKRMNEIMPYYNDMYKAAAIDFDPLSTIDMRTVGNNATTTDTDSASNTTTDTDNESTSTTANTAGSRAVNSEFPQTMLNNSGDYATAATDSNSQSDSNVTTSDDARAEQATTEHAGTVAEQDTLSHTTGYQGIPATILTAYRDSLVNVDMMVISELEDLFMFVYDNGDEYTSQYRRF